MKNFNAFYLIMFLSITLFSCCKDEPKCQDPTKIECENYDPCYGKKPISAAFKIEELVGSRWFETDTVARKVKFTALEEADSYTWYLGSEVITEKSFDRFGFPRNTWIDIKLVVKKKVDACFPNSSSVDSLKKRFYVWPETELSDGDYIKLINPYPIYGTYYGSLKSNPSLKFNATLLDTNWVNEANVRSRPDIIRGIPYPPNYASDKLSRNTYGAFFDGDAPCALSIFSKEYRGSLIPAIIPAMKGYAWLDKGDHKTITIAYSFKDTLTQLWKIDTFRGKKIY
jgi:hypothetical protein